MSWLWGKRLQKNDSANICTVEITSELCDGDAQNYAELKKSHNSSPVKKNSRNMKTVKRRVWKILNYY
jgi:hypothetical protein